MSNLNYTFKRNKMKNKLYRMYYFYCQFFECRMPVKPKYGNYYLRGLNGRFRKINDLS